MTHEVMEVTLQNLRYLVEIANHQSFSSAAKALFVSQSALSAAVREVEDELGIQIFHRTNRGVSLTPDGEDCLRYCREIVDRSDHLLSRYQARGSVSMYFSVSAQHLPFAVRAFNDLQSHLKSDGYDIAFREEATADVLRDVEEERSELGIVSFQQELLPLIQKHLNSRDLVFTETAQMNAYVFVRKLHPLAAEDAVSLEDLREYPLVTYDMDQAASYFTEESVSMTPTRGCIHVCDRATKMAVIRNTNAFSIGIDLPNFNQDFYFRDRTTELAAIPLKDLPAEIHVGYVTKAGHLFSQTAEQYLTLLQSHIERLIPPGSAVKKA
jgi:DNA-binding transcriptional LysR family regulator